MGILVTTPNKLLHMHGKNTAQQESYQESSLLLLGVKLIQLKRHAEWFCWHASIFTPVLEYSGVLETVVLLKK